MAHFSLMDNSTSKIVFIISLTIIIIVPDYPDNCTDGVQWILVTFGQCLVTPIEISGFYLGLFSILCWFLVYIPQLYENYKR